MAVPQLLETQPGHELSLTAELFRLGMNFKGCRDLDAHLTPQARTQVRNLVPTYLLSPVSDLLCSNLHFHDESQKAESKSLCYFTELKWQNQRYQIGRN